MFYSEVYGGLLFLCTITLSSGTLIDKHLFKYEAKQSYKLLR